MGMEWVRVIFCLALRLTSSFLICDHWYSFSGAPRLVVFWLTSSWVSLRNGTQTSPRVDVLGSSSYAAMMAPWQRSWANGQMPLCSAGCWRRLQRIDWKGTRPIRQDPSGIWWCEKDSIVSSVSFQNPKFPNLTAYFWDIFGRDWNPRGGSVYSHLQLPSILGLGKRGWVVPFPAD